MPKIITSECCELVKLCDINCSDPVFLDTLYFMHTKAVQQKMQTNRHFHERCTVILAEVVPQCLQVLHINKSTSSAMHDILVPL